MPKVEGSKQPAPTQWPAPYWTDGEMIRLYQGDVREQLKLLPAQSVHTLITSPPYFSLRDYGTGQWTGGNAACDHVNPEKVAERERQRKSMQKVGERCDGSSRTGVHHTEIGAGTQFKNECKKCGAKRTDSQMGSEAVLSCDQHEFMTLRSDLTEEEKTAVLAELRQLGLL